MTKNKRDNTLMIFMGFPLLDYPNMLAVTIRKQKNRSRINKKRKGSIQALHTHKAHKA